MDCDSPLVGSVVVHTNEVCFYAFRANSGDAVKTYRVPVKNVFTVRPGHAEQDPKAILNAVRVCVENTVVAGSVCGANVVAVGLSNHRSSVVAWDKNTGAPLCNAILWSDNRSACVANEYSAAGSGDAFRFQKVCGLPFSPYFSAFKIAWLLRNVIAVINAYKEGRCYFGTVDSWLLWNLTGGMRGACAVRSGSVGYGCACGCRCCTIPTPPPVLVSGRVSVPLNDVVRSYTFFAKKMKKIKKRSRSQFDDGNSLFRT